MSLPALQRFWAAVEEAARTGTWVKLTLGKYRGPVQDLENVFVRPVDLKAGRRMSFLYRYKTRDETKNLEIDAALAQLREWVPGTFRDAHLFLPVQTHHFMGDEVGGGRLRTLTAKVAPKIESPTHDREKEYAIRATEPWLQDLGVTGAPGQVKAAMTSKFRQINRFVELLAPLVAEVAGAGARPLSVKDMGSGKGYLTFALATAFGRRVSVVGVEQRPELVDTCNAVARKHALDNLRFEQGRIDPHRLDSCDIMIALHACDTATDDALAAGIAGGARLLVVSPCCQKELRPQFVPPAVLEPALRHGIFVERQAEFATDALRGLLLEWVGYRTKTFEFISTEHTAKNLMITATKVDGGRSAEAGDAIQAFASFYGIRSQRLAAHLMFTLAR
ncbi:MAG: SAM-dependent methyltransferase [Opitutaceae bacterium]|nr:SAM-dependent methyltransferase [Opitutaceae bacterium]